MTNQTNNQEPLRGQAAAQYVRETIDRAAPSDEQRAEAQEALAAVLASHDEQWLAQADILRLKQAMAEYIKAQRAG